MAADPRFAARHDAQRCDWHAPGRGYPLHAVASSPPGSQPRARRYGGPAPRDSHAHATRSAPRLRFAVPLLARGAAATHRAPPPSAHLVPLRRFARRRSPRARCCRGRSHGDAALVLGAAVAVYLAPPPLCSAPPQRHTRRQSSRARRCGSGALVAAAPALGAAAAARSEPSSRARRCRSNSPGAGNPSAWFRCSGSFGVAALTRSASHPRAVPF